MRMNRLPHIICICLLAGVTFLVYKAKKTPSPAPPRPRHPNNGRKPPKPPPPPKPAKPVEPVWLNWPVVHEVHNPALGQVLCDIDSHMPAHHQYRASNKITWAHETTHGINANIRNSQPGQKVNGFYTLRNRAVVIPEPPTTIRTVAPTVPHKLRGVSYDLYLVRQAGQWNHAPLYLFDEWTAYTNGSECGRELNAQGWYFELLQAHEFNLYSLCLAKVVKENCPNYDDKQMKAYLMWNIERTFRLAAPTAPKRYVLSGPFDHHINANIISFPDDENPTQKALEYAEKVRTLPEAESLRSFARSYFGPDWCRRVYGF